MSDTVMTWLTVPRTFRCRIGPIFLLWLSSFALCVSISYAAESDAWVEAIRTDDTASLIALLPESDPNFSDEQGRTALMVAAKYADLHLINLLVENGARVDQQSFTGGSGLMFAVLSGEVEAVRALISHGAVVSNASRNGWTALILASAKNQREMVDVLLEHGSRPLHADVYGFNALMRAVENRHHAIVQRLLRENSAQLLQRDSLGNTALHYAANAGDETLLTWLLDAGAESSANNRGFTPIDLLPSSVGGSSRSRLLSQAD